MRRHLNAHRPELTRVAVELYPGCLRVEGTALLGRRAWVPAEPVEVGDLALG